MQNRIQIEKKKTCSSDRDLPVLCPESQLNELYPEDQDDNNSCHEVSTNTFIDNNSTYFPLRNFQLGMNTIMSLSESLSNIHSWLTMEICKYNSACVTK